MSYLRHAGGSVLDFPLHSRSHRGDHPGFDTSGSRRGLDLTCLREASGSHRLVGPPAAVLRHAGATQRLDLREDEPPPKRRWAPGKQKCLHAFGADKPSAVEKPRWIVCPGGWRAEIPAMAKMLSDRANVGVLPFVADH